MQEATFDSSVDTATVQLERPLKPQGGGNGKLKNGKGKGHKGEPKPDCGIDTIDASAKNWLMIPALNCEDKDDIQELMESFLEAYPKYADSLNFKRMSAIVSAIKNQYRRVAAKGGRVISRGGVFISTK